MTLCRHWVIYMYLATCGFMSGRVGSRGLLKAKQRVCGPNDQPSICDGRRSQYPFSQFDFMSRFGIFTLVFNDQSFARLVKDVKSVF